MCTKFERLSTEQKLLHLNSVATRALAHWALPSDSKVELISWSENATYRITHSSLAAPLAMRVHRTEYHTHNAILTELAWMRALKSDAHIKTPQAVMAKDGDYVQAFSNDELDETRFVVVFEWIAGEAPDETHLLAPFSRLGEVTARLHQHAKRWQQPAFFERLVWDFDGCLGDIQLWGDWREAPGLTPEHISVLAQAVKLIKARLQIFGMGRERFGLIHADLRLANLLESDGETRVIDFDDAGLGWFLYDLASALSFIETRSDVPELISAWLKGYRKVAVISAEEEAEIPTFIMLRRLTLLAWIASHEETELAQSQGEAFAKDTVELAQQFLARMQMTAASTVGHSYA